MWCGAGVPHVSVLDAILFLLYTKELHVIIRICNSVSNSSSSKRVNNYGDIVVEAIHKIQRDNNELDERGEWLIITWFIKKSI